MKPTWLALALLTSALPVSAQQLRFDDVVRNLRNPDPKMRLSAIHLLRDAKYPEAIGPIAALVNDPVDEIQLEAIAAELSFFLERDLRSKRMVGFVLEKRRSGLGRGAFELGPYAVWPRPAAPELVSALLQAIDDENAKVRADAMYAAGVIGRSPLTADQIARLTKGLDHYDPAIRAGAARVIARLKVAEAGDALIKAVNDSQAEVRYESIRALGAIGEQRAITALTEQLAYYKKGEGAWSALEALARIGSRTSLPLFRERLQDRDPYIRRAAIEGIARAGDTESIDALERAAMSDEAAMVRLAAVFALQKLGRTYAARIVDLMSSEKMIPQAQEYLVELGTPLTVTLVARLQEPDPNVREAVADVLGIIGDASVVPALQAASKDRDPSVASAAKRALARLRGAE